jgi:hypothetical protein
VEELYRVLWNENCGGCVSMEQKSFALLNVLGSIFQWGQQHHFGRLTCWFYRKLLSGSDKTEDPNQQLPPDFRIVKFVIHCCTTLCDTSQD